MKNILLTLFLLTLQLTVVCQDMDSVSMNDNPLEKIDYETIQIPPVSVFIAAARNYSDVKLYEERQKEAELLLKASKKEWLKYIRLQGNYQYGTNSSYVLQSGEQYPGGLENYSTSNTQSWYNAGVIVSIPLDDIFNRKTKNDVARSRVSQYEYESLRTLEERQILILESYNSVLKHMALLKVKAEAVALYNAQMKISETDFVNGRIDIIALSLERARRSEAIVKYQESRAELHNAVTILEMLTGIQISRK